MLALGVVVAAAIGLVDYSTGPNVSLSVFYLLPILVVTLEAGRRAGYVTAAASAVAWAAADALTNTPYSRTTIIGWNAIVRLAVYCINVYLLAALGDALARARRSDLRSREFLGYAAHQLRTPLAGIRASAELLARDVDVVSRERLLTNLLRESARAGRLITELLRLARLDQGDSPLRRACDIRALCAGELGRLGDLGPDLRTELRVAAEPPEAYVDEECVKEALAVLLDNARRHAEHEIVVTLGWEQQSVLIAVADDGPGPPPEAAEAVFDRFVSLDGHGGSGLGLAIARGIARAHGGDVFYDGRAFVLRLPSVAPPRRPRRARHGQHEPHEQVLSSTPG
jgi:signal transduction histidine kinase